MSSIDAFLPAFALAPAALMTAAAVLLTLRPGADTAVWARFRVLAALALPCALAQPVALWALQGQMSTQATAGWVSWLSTGQLTAWMAALVQLLGTVIGVFSARYLHGEPGQRRYAGAFAGVLASVHLLLLAGHWLMLIIAWAAVGLCLRRLLCFYTDRPFALLAAHKKRIADRLADLLLLAAAALAWTAVGSGSFADLWAHLAHQGASVALQASAVCLVLAVVLRTALFPVHGWLIQVMEAPTPVSALLHAGVVNLGGYLLIQFAPLLAVSPAARWLLVAFGLGTALLAGLVMLTRISIKVRLAWSTVAQMGFMVLECGLGLYELAALHLIAHSLYKAHAFLSASSIVRETRSQMMRGRTRAAAPSLMLAPAGSIAIVLLVQALLAAGDWPWWWNGVLALAWAPLLWVPVTDGGAAAASGQRMVFGATLVAVLTAVAALAHRLPLGVSDAPFHAAGPVALAGMALLYLCLTMLQWRPERFAVWHRWSYAGFYVDELYTRLALRLWPARWTPDAALHTPPPSAGTQPAVNEK
ncbi:NADH-quinone oxidoreductase subunit L [Nitrogeniibacter mangrovi]|uniref:Probable inorganic carbon transporter subunit DabB n=1 Tax=Nitrogeniibacter mangrovi TaxID=2016596 RepID=A0A6C1B7Q1_9RHOO|nr:NADH-quinone oxidoreductase subunit L [Nitrogeniibacter mangrovi]QID18340.1 NADH-quinone oxidoreductase subunit L [Nitrogeniibacter mangrovi]